MTTRKPYDDVIMAELSRLLRQEMAAGLSTVFSAIGNQMSGAASAQSPVLQAPLNVVINNNASATVTAHESTGPMGQRQLEITIDQMVARALAGGKETSGILRTLFGLAPGLIGR